MDKVIIKDLRARGIIGVNDWERDKPQEILINITVFTDTRRAGETDRPRRHAGQQPGHAQLDCAIKWRQRDHGIPNLPRHVERDEGPRRHRCREHHRVHGYAPGGGDGPA